MRQFGPEQMIGTSDCVIQGLILIVLFNSIKFELNPSGIYTMNFIYVDRRE
jgi:hypothetical protein